jgi:large subunit ribosomal protein L19
MKNRLMALVEESGLKKDIPDFEVGDTVDVHLRILEGQKERIQIFNGVVLGRRGQGMSEMFTVRRIVQGEGVERSFPIHSPKIAKIEVKRTGVTRRAKLYYLRDRVGKATRLRERKKKAEKAPIVPGTPEAPLAYRPIGREPRERASGRCARGAYG